MKFHIEDGVLYSFQTENIYNNVLVVPEGVTHISSKLHSCRDSRYVKSIFLPDGLQEIEENAFSDFRYLKDVRLPYGLKVIGKDAFLRCSELVNAEIPHTVEEIGSDAFLGCSLEHISIPPKVTVIRDGAFHGCPLKEIELHDNITYIGRSAFYGSRCTEIIVPDSVEHIEGAAFGSCFYLEKVTFPKKLKEIKFSLFENCTSLKSIVIPEGVTKIEHSAFENCGKLESITLPESLTAIGVRAFGGCDSLRSISIPRNVKEIAENDECVSVVFKSKNLEQINVAEENEYFASYDGVLYTKDFSRLLCCPAGKSSIIFHGSVKEIASSAFYECNNISELIIPESVEKIENSAFYGCHGLKRILFPKNAKNIESSIRGGYLKEIAVSEDNPDYAAYDGVLYNKSFEELLYCPYEKEKIKFHKNLKRIKSFDSRKITKIVIPDGVEYLESLYAKSAESVVIPKGCAVGDSVSFNNGFEKLKKMSVYGVEFKTDRVFVKNKKSNKSINCREVVRLIIERDYNVKMDHNVKFPIVCRMFFADIEGAFEYVKKNFAKIFRVLIDNENKDDIQKLLECGKFITKKNIDKFIEYAQENKIKGMLEDYKSNL